MLGEQKPADVLSPNNNRVEIESINEALDFLFEGLLAANRLIVEERDAGRRGVIEALNVVTEFLSFFQGTTDHRQPFTYLLSALLSLEEGDVLPLLKQSAGRSGRRPASPAGNATKPWRWLRCTGFAKPGSTPMKLAKWLPKFAARKASNLVGKEPKIVRDKNLKSRIAPCAAGTRRSPRTLAAIRRPRKPSTA
jgi:hypothetical protein